MKNKGLIIFTIILLSITIFLLVLFLVTYLSGGVNFRSGIINFSSKSTNVIYDNQFDLENIKNIEIKQDAGDIIFKETTDDKIKVVVYGEEANDVQVDLNNGNLNIDYTHKNNFLFINFSFGNVKKDIIIYIPSDYSNEIKIKNDYGKCEMTDLENATVNIDCNAGDVELGKVKNATIKCDLREHNNRRNIK